MGDEEQGFNAKAVIGHGAVVRAVFWRLADGIGIEVFSLGFFLILGRLLEPISFGIVSIAGTFIQSCQVLLNAGFSTAVQQKAHLEPNI